jgi:hypothetical protein
MEGAGPKSAKAGAPIDVHTRGLEPMADLLRKLMDFASAHPLATVLVFSVITWAVLYLLWRKSK